MDFKLDEINVIIIEEMIRERERKREDIMKQLTVLARDIGTLTYAIENIRKANDVKPFRN